MLDQFIPSAPLVRRLRVGVLGAVLDEFVRDLAGRGHAARTIRDYVGAAGQFARWLDIAGIPLATLSDANVEAFVEERARRRRGVRSADGVATSMHASLGHLLAMLRARGTIAPRAARPRTSIDTVVEGFLEYSRATRGLRPSTLRSYGRDVRAFLAAQFEDEAVALSSLTGDDVRAFVVRCAVRHPGKTAQCTASALRAFLRFLVVGGQCEAHLVAAVPAVSCGLVHVPSRLTDSQLADLFAAFDRTTPMGRRDYALALCLARLGLRVGEAVGLRLDDLDWRQGTLQLVTGKARRAALLPLASDVGEGLAAYLADARPATLDRHVFVTHVVPIGRPLKASAARGAIRRAFARAGLGVPSRGTHVLRHTVATQMLSGGATLKEVADVLRHRSLDTAAVYAKVDLPTLQAVAMPWPAVS